MQTTSEQVNNDTIATVVKYRLAGNVQRVGFRHFLKEKAAEHNLSGYAQNEQDGSLIVMLSGCNEDIGKVVPLLQQGPPGARIAAVTELLSEDDNPPAADEFLIR